MNRRDFLQPRRLAQTAGQIAAALEPLTVEPVAECQGEGESESLTLLRYARRAMATGFEVALSLGTPNAAEAATDSLDLLEALEAQLTVYREDSDISRFNRHAADGAMPVEPRLFQLLELAERIYLQSAG